MDGQILDRLSALTEEELRLRENGGRIDWALYSPGGRARASSGRLLEDGRLIRLRPHVRVPHFPRHSHDYLEIVYMCRGSTRHVLADGAVIALGQGELMLLNQAVVHEVYQDDPQALAVNLLILPAFFRLSFDLGGEQSPLEEFLFSVFRAAREPAWLVYRVADCLPIQNLMENLIWSLLQEETGRLALEQNTMHLLFQELLMRQAPEGAASGSAQVLVLHALQYVEANYRDGTLTDLARQEGRPAYEVSRQVKRSTGCTFQELIQTARLVQAAALLRDTDLTVSDIAEAVGYHNMNYFYRIFKDRYHMTLSAYRRQKRGL